MIKKGIKVKILTGKDKKKEGEVIEIDRKNNRAKVKEINLVKKHVKTTKEKKGGIFPQENFIHMSNLLIIDDKKIVQNSLEDISLISGQRAIITKFKKSISNFKTRKGAIAGVKVTLRANRMYEFIDR